MQQRHSRMDLHKPKIWVVSLNFDTSVNHPSYPDLFSDIGTINCSFCVKVRLSTLGHLFADHNGIKGLWVVAFLDESQMQNPLDSDQQPQENSLNECGDLPSNRFQWKSYINITFCPWSQLVVYLTFDLKSVERNDKNSLCP